MSVDLSSVASAKEESLAKAQLPTYSTAVLPFQYSSPPIQYSRPPHSVQQSSHSVQQTPSFSTADPPLQYSRPSIQYSRPPASVQAPSHLSTATHHFTLYILHFTFSKRLVSRITPSHPSHLSHSSHLSHLSHNSAFHPSTHNSQLSTLNSLICVLGATLETWIFRNPPHNKRKRKLNKCKSKK